MIFRTLSILCLLVLAASNVFAQSEKDKALLSLLESYPEEISSIALYTVTSRTKIIDLNITNNKLIVHSKAPGDGWSNVTFEEQGVPVWASDNFIKFDGKKAQVIESVLNARLSPTTKSAVVTVLQPGYTSDVLDHSDGFFKINAPLDTLFLVRNEDINKLVPSLVSRGVQTKQAASFTNVVKVSQSNSSQLLDQPRVEKARLSSPGSFVDNARVSQVKVSDDGRSHKIAPGDSISLLVFGESDLSQENIRVPESGNVSLPLIGTVNVVGKNTTQVENEVRTILSSGYVKNPRLSVSIFSYRPIFIRGAVQNTGSFPYTQGLTISKALTLAGGTLNSAKVKGISVLRDGNVVQADLMLDSQYQISSGDVITVAEEQGVREDESLFIYLHGEVVSPGEYRFRKGLTVEKAIVLSGGFTLRASRRKINITRYINVEENAEPENLKNVKLYTPIMPGDVIKVRASLF